MLSEEEILKRKQAAEQLRKAVQMYILTLPEERALEVAAVYPEWKTGMGYAVGDIISYGTNNLGDPQLYKVVQVHTSQADWLPSETPSLYDAFGLDESGYPIWAQPAGAHDAYNIGDIVNYNGKLYKSLINGNVWSPDVYAAGWELYENKDEEEPPVTPEPEPGEPGTQEYPDFVQPSGAHDAYKTGDIVKYNGQLYKSKIDNNVWSPSEYPAGWEVYNP